MNSQTQKAFSTKKGLSYGEIILDNILGLDNEYESFGEQLGKAINKDEIRFLKDAAVGVYEGTKEFIANPVDTTKEVVVNIKDSVQRLGTENLDARIKRMYNVSYDQATDQQVTSAKEAVFGDALTALELIPAAKAGTVTARAAVSAIPSGVKADVVGQTKALLTGDTEFLKGTPTERSTTVGVGAEVVNQDDVNLDDIAEYMDSEIKPTKPKKETNPLVRETNYAGIRVGDTADFKSSVLGSLDNLAIGKDGMSGFRIKKFLEKRAPKINKTELYWSGLLENLDDNKKYTSRELEKIVDRNVPRIRIDVYEGSNTKYRGMQRVAILKSDPPNDKIYEVQSGYREILLKNTNTKGTEYETHFSAGKGENVLAHVRGSFVETSSRSKEQGQIGTGKITNKEKVFLVEELQSDAVQQHIVADKTVIKEIEKEKKGQLSLGDIGLHYRDEINDLTSAYFMQGLDLTDKFVKKIDSYNYNFRKIGDQDDAEQAISLGLTGIIDDFTRLKNSYLNFNTDKDAILIQLSRKYGLKESSIQRRSIPELDEIDNVFANVLSDYVFGKSAVRKWNKEYNNEFKEDLINLFKDISAMKSVENELVPAKLSDTIRMSLLAVIKESKAEGVNKIYVPSPEVMHKVHDLNLGAAKNTYDDGLKKVLRSLNKETNNKIKFKNKNPNGISYYLDTSSTGIEIDITDFELPDNPQFRFNMGGLAVDNFAEGGTVMNEQMKMAFMQEGGLRDDGMRVDPVSGNEIPPGSMAKEVRDDIPAQLSEGEYVVPADVVQYFGVKYFEDLRMEAKRGLQGMEVDGRIGGQPVDSPQQTVSDEELEMLIRQEMGQSNMNEGGLMGYQEGGTPAAPVSTFDPSGFGTLGSTTFGSAASPTTGGATQVVVLYAPDGTPITLVLPRDKGTYDQLLAQGYTLKKPEEEKEEPKKDSSGPSAPEVESKPWYESINWENPVEQAKGMFKQKDSSGIGLMSVLSGVQDLSNVAKMRATVNLLESAGRKDEADEIRGLVEGFVDSSSTMFQTAANSLAPGTWNTNKGMTDLDTNLDGLLDANDKLIIPGLFKTATVTPTAPEPVVTPNTNSGAPSSSDNKPSVAERLMQERKQKEKEDKTSRIKTSTFQSSMPSATQKREAQKAAQKKQVSTKTKKELSGAQMKAGLGIGSGKGGRNVAGPMNKGGLMKKK